MRIKRLLVTVAFAAFTAAAIALPTVDAVQAEVQRGNYAQAEVMMQDVVAAKPGSARAHYIYAEILAHNKRFDQAAKETARARQIDPAISFADAAKFKSLESLLEREQQAAKPRTAPMTAAAPAPASLRTASPAQPSGGVPTWVWVLGLAGIAAAVWMLVTRRQQAAAMPMARTASPMGANAAAGYAPGYGAGAAPGYGPGPGYGQQPSGGMGLMGIGLAAAGGVAAGMLAERMLHGGHDTAGNAASGMGAGANSSSLYDQAPVDNAAARELEQRPVDFGKGDGWGGDGGGGGGSSDDSSDGW